MAAALLGDSVHVEVRVSQVNPKAQLEIPMSPNASYVLSLDFGGDSGWVDVTDRL
jgi:hypothetical protein